MAADSGHRARALRYPGGRVVRAARAEERHALRRRVDIQRGPFAGGDHGQPRLNSCAHVRRKFQLADAGRDRLGHDRRGKLVGRRQNPVSLRHGPFAPVLLVELADYARHALASADPLEQLLFQLILDHLPFFFHHQDFGQAFGEIVDRPRLQRPHHRAFEQSYADAPAGLLVQSQVDQRLARVQVRLAAGHDAEARLGRVDLGAVEPVLAAVRQSGVQLVIEQPRFLRERRVGPADVQARRRHREILGQPDADPLRIDDHRAGCFDHFGHAFEPDPHAGVPAHRIRVQPQIQVFLDRGRKQHRNQAGLQDVIGLVRQRGALGAVIVADRNQHAPLGAGAGRVGVLEHVAAAIDAGALAVPHREHAVVLGAGEHVDLLSAPHRSGGQVLVDPGLEMHVVPFQMRARPDRGHVDAAQRRTAVSAQKAGRVQAAGQVALALQHQKAHQRLRSAQVDGPAIARPSVLEARLLQRLAQIWVQRCVHRFDPFRQTELQRAEVRVRRIL